MDVYSLWEKCVIIFQLSTVFWPIMLNLTCFPHNPEPTFSLATTMAEATALKSLNNRRRNRCGALLLWYKYQLLVGKVEKCRCNSLSSGWNGWCFGTKRLRFDFRANSFGEWSNGQGVIGCKSCDTLACWRRKFAFGRFDEPAVRDKVLRTQVLRQWARRLSGLWVDWLG